MHTAKHSIISIWIALSCASLHALRRRIHTPQICHTPATAIEPGDATLFIHGTVFPGISRIFNHKERRRGLYRYSAGTRGPNIGHQRLGRVLHDASPEEFPAESFYKYYWAGELTFEDRKKAAQELYSLLKTHIGKLTIIAHSHGCNVALHLAEVAQNQNPNFKIDRLILLAPPVQQATAQFVSSPVYKRIYSFYSTADFLQVADPQGLYDECKEASIDKTPLFSKRTYQKNEKLSQARIFITHRSPSHRDFVLPKFFRHLPALLDILDNAQDNGKDHIIINVPIQRNRVPHIVEHAQGYVPRRVRSCKCHPKQPLYRA